MKLPVIQKDDYADQSACLRCVEDGGGCCTGAGSGIFVTLHDVLRVQKKSGLSLNEIAVFKEVDAKHAKDVKETDPYFYQFFRDNKILQLVRKDDFCRFLVQGEGCLVFDNRPAICRMFPFSFDFTKEGKIKIVVPKASKRKWEDCTIIEENYYRSKGATLRAMNSSFDKMTELIKEHIIEIEKYGEYVDEIAQGVSLNEIVEKYNIRI